MALGTWPREVAERWRVEPKRFASEGELGRFVESSAEAGWTGSSRAGDLLVDDFDGDGALDLFRSSFDTGAPLHFARGSGTGSFRDVTDEAQLAGQLGGGRMRQADVDGDGRLDLFVLRGGGLYPEDAMPDSLLVGDSTGGFLDVTVHAGLDRLAASRCAAFADVDGDGDLDLYVGCGSEIDGLYGGAGHTSLLYANDGAGCFVDVTASASLDPRPGMVAGALLADLDGDGYPELYLSIQSGPNRLYRNLGDGRFEERVSAGGAIGPAASGAVAAFDFDFDQDGDLDLALADRGAGLRERQMAGWLLNPPAGEAVTVHLYQNDGSGEFEEVTATRGLHRPTFAIALGTGDLDADGYPDLYATTGDAAMGALWPHLMLRNVAGGRFEDVTSAGGFGHVQKGSAVAFADADEDGAQEVFVKAGGFHLDDDFTDLYFENPGHAHRWLIADLRGREVNRYGVGARVRVSIEEAGLRREVFGYLGHLASAGGNPCASSWGWVAPNRSSSSRSAGRHRAERVATRTSPWTRTSS